MNPKMTKLIDQYLTGVLRGDEKSAFEQELAQSIELQQEVELQRSIMDAAARASQRNEVKEAAKRFRRKRLLRNGGISALISIFVASTILFFSSNNSSQNKETTKEIAPISAETKNKLDKNQDFDNIPIQYFQIPTQGSVQLSEKGVLISVPEAAFLKNGEPYRGNVILQYQEAIQGVDIIKSGLSTMTGDQLLETQGMFSVTGYTEDGEALHFNPEVGVYLQTPVDECVEGMRLFDGKKREDGSIDWVNPEPLNKIPTITKMAELDFYPEGYEEHLDAQKWKRDKKSRDSLYLSLEHTMDVQQLESITSTNSGRIRPIDEGVIEIQRNMGKVYRKRDKSNSNVPGIDESITWSFTKELLGNDVWQITATGVIAPGFYVPTMNDADSSIQTQLIISESEQVRMVEAPNTSSPVRTIKTSSGTTRGYTNQVVIGAKVKVKSHYQTRVPVRVVFKLSSADMAYSRAMRGGDMTLWESPEDRTARLDSLASIQMNGTFILPSKVLGFWRPQFNNTLLSSREFERRMKAIHRTCDNEVLEVYIENLNMPMAKLDREVVRMGYPEFEQFANENVGSVNISDPHLALLNDFYEKTSNMLWEDAQVKVKSEEGRMKQWNKIVQKQGEKDRERARERNLQYANNLTNFTRTNVMRHFQKTQGFKIRKGSNDAPTARKNIDALRPYAGIPVVDVRGSREKALEVTIIRQKIKYNDLEISIANFSKFENVYLYLYADEINSYQRIDPDSSGVIKCLLQDDISYGIGVVGITKEGFSYYDHAFVKGGNLGTIQLKSIREEDLKARIEKMNAERLPNNELITREFDWLRTKRKNYKVQQVYKEMIEFRQEVKAVVFPCVSFQRDSKLSATNDPEELELQVNVE